MNAFNLFTNSVLLLYFCCVPLGFVGQQGLEDSSSSSINQLQNVLLSILKKRSDSTKKGNDCNYVICAIISFSPFHIPFQ